MSTECAPDRFRPREDRGMLTELDLREGLEQKTKLFRGFSDSSRLAILESLREGARSVSEIVEATGLTQSNASNHLGCLLGCGLVLREQRGRFVYYSLSDSRVVDLLELSDTLLAGVAREIESCRGYEAADAD
jgi:DNA-binding transcriptional ArsR family regulator